MKQTIKPRKTIVAMLLSMICNGLGQIYNGQLKKGLIFIGITFLLIFIPAFLGAWATFITLAIHYAVIFLFRVYMIVDSIIWARKLKEYKPKVYTRWYLYPIYILVFYLLILPGAKQIFLLSPYQTFSFPTSSMRNTILMGDHVISNCKYYNHKKPQRGDIMVFQVPGHEEKLYSKRVIGLPGDTIRIENKTLWLNGKILNEEYVYWFDEPPLKVFPPNDTFQWSPDFPEQFKQSLIDTANGPAFKVPGNHYFCLGDNRNLSHDCRFFGPVQADRIRGKLLYIYWSVELMAIDYYFETRLITRIKRFIKSVITFPKRTRWKRISKTIK